jgi:hypothetical protein
MFKCSAAFAAWRETASASSHESAQDARFRVPQHAGCGGCVLRSGSHCEVQPHEARLVDARRLRPRTALQRVVGAVGIDRVVRGRIVGVEQGCVSLQGPNTRVTTSRVRDVFRRE